MIEQIFGKEIEILMVEDNLGDIRLVQENFKDQLMNKSNLHLAKDGVEAILFLKKEGDYINSPTPDIILLDMNLPRKTGKDVLYEINQIEELKRIPLVILVSSENHEFDLEEMNIKYYIVKPVNTDNFMEISKKLFNLIVS